MKCAWTWKILMEIKGKLNFELWVLLLLKNYNWITFIQYALVLIQNSILTDMLNILNSNWEVKKTNTAWKLVDTKVMLVTR